MRENYDLGVQSRRRSDGALGPALEVLSGGLREWLYEAIVERCLFALCRGEAVRQVDQVSLFGKNPDSCPLYLFEQLPGGCARESASPDARA